MSFVESVFLLTVKEEVRLLAVRVFSFAFLFTALKNGLFDIVEDLVIAETANDFRTLISGRSRVVENMLHVTLRTLLPAHFTAKLILLSWKVLFVFFLFALFTHFDQRISFFKTLTFTWNIICGGICLALPRRMNLLVGYSRSEGRTKLLLFLNLNLAMEELSLRV